MHGTWDGDSGTLAEHFRYDSGTTQDREWRLTLQSGGRIRAEADDLVGRGEGTQKGAAVQLRYTIPPARQRRRARAGRDRLAVSGR